MLASRVGMIGVFVAVLVLSAELVGAIAVKRHLSSDFDGRLSETTRQLRAEIDRLDTELNKSLCSRGYCGERDARRALEDAITVRKGLGDATQVDPAAERMRREERSERLDDQLIGAPDSCEQLDGQVPNRAGY